MPECNIGTYPKLSTIEQYLRSADKPGQRGRPGSLTRRLEGMKVLLGCSQNLAQGLVHFQSSVVADESLRPESIHEEIDSRARCANHLRQNLVAQNRNLGSWRTPSVQVGQPQEDARQPLFGRGSKQFRHMILIQLHARQQIGHQGI